MIVILKVAFCFLLALVVTSVSECLFHKYLFHKNIKWVARITKLWNYNPERHTHHHKVCFKEMDDAVDSEEEYWVQRPSNTFAACGVVSLLEVLFLWLIGFQWPYMVLQVFFTICTFTFWYYFEDHFHLAMHKPDYYKKHIQGTW